MMEDGHCVATVHAEANAIIQAAKNGVGIDGASIYTTASPCWPCFKLIANAGCRRIVFAEFYRDPRIFEVAGRLGIELVELQAGAGVGPGAQELGGPGDDPAWAVALGKRSRFREVEQDRLALIGHKAQAAAVAVVEGERDAACALGPRPVPRLRRFDLRHALGLPEMLFTVQKVRGDRGKTDFVFLGRGWGHGVGLCQNGAFGMALAGRTYDQILRHYYSGIEVVTASDVTAGPPSTR